MEYGEMVFYWILASLILGPFLGQFIAAQDQDTWED
jgi:hypothetical protein